MAKVVDGILEITPRATYPWDQWFDGRTWELTPGEDFNCQLQYMRGAVYTAARRLGKKIKTRSIGGKFYIRAEPSA